MAHMKLGLFIRPTGHHIASWRHPNAHDDANVNFDRFIEMAQTAERAFLICSSPRIRIPPGRPKTQL